MMTATITTYCLSCDRPASAFCVAYHDTRTYEQPRPEQAGSEATRDDDECAFTHALPSGSVRCGALRRHHSQYTGHKFTEPETRRQHCGRPMRYDKISNGDVFNAQRLTGTYYCEQCCTMQPTYEAVNDAPAAPERGDDGVNRYLKSEIEHLLKENSTLITQRERLLEGLRLAVDWMQGRRGGPSEGLLAAQVIKQLESVITTSEQEGRTER